jgi:plastocyanin
MNRKVVIGIIIALVTIVVTVVLVVSLQKPSAAPSSETLSGTNTPDTVASATITYNDQGFSPKSLSVKAGNTIRIVNQSSIGLQFSSDFHPTHTKDPELNMRLIDSGKDGMLKVTRTGTWGFHNHERASDTGSLMVTQ